MIKCSSASPSQIIDRIVYFHICNSISKSHEIELQSLAVYSRQDNGDTIIWTACRNNLVSLFLGFPNTRMRKCKTLHSMTYTNIPPEAGHVLH